MCQISANIQRASDGQPRGKVELRDHVNPQFVSGIKVAIGWLLGQRSYAQLGVAAQG
jgi:hypothetical protein